MAISRKIGGKKFRDKNSRKKKGERIIRGGGKGYDYDYSDQIGQGNYGTVYEAKCVDENEKIQMHCNAEDNSKYIIKKIIIDGDSIYVRRSKLTYVIQQEISIQKKVHDSPYIASIHKWEMAPSSVYILMERAESFIPFYDREWYKLIPDIHNQIYYGMYAGLVHIHSLKILHRDIKPDNFIVKKISESLYILKYIDFGLSVQLTLMNPTTSDNKGSLYYVCPEIKKKIKYSYGCDIWSLGITYLQLLTGQQPYDFLYIYYSDSIFSKYSNFKEFVPDTKMELFKQYILEEIEKDRMSDTTNGLHIFLLHKMDNIKNFQIYRVPIAFAGGLVSFKESTRIKYFKKTWKKIQDTDQAKLMNKAVQENKENEENEEKEKKEEEEEMYVAQEIGPMTWATKLQNWVGYGVNARAEKKKNLEDALRAEATKAAEEAASEKPASGEEAREKPTAVELHQLPPPEPLPSPAATTARRAQLPAPAPRARRAQTSALAEPTKTSEPSKVVNVGGRKKTNKRKRHRKKIISKKRRR